MLTTGKLSCGMSLGAVGRAAVVVVYAMMAPGCFLDRGALEPEGCTADDNCGPGQGCVDGSCVPLIDAGDRDGGVDGGIDGAIDGGLDSGVEPDAGTDAGPPAHCSDGIVSSGESDVDCGGPCPGCDLCDTCTADLDCAGGTCRDGLCREALSTITTDTGGTISAYVRDDGAILLAYYEPRAGNRAYDITARQLVDRTGGGAPAAGWAPDPCTQSGHLAFSQFIPGGRRVVMECGASRDDIRYTASSSTVFTDFSGGLHGTIATAGDPGWGAIASIGTGDGRVSHAMCGTGTSMLTGGISYCDSFTSGSLYQHHVVSFTTAQSGFSYVGCGRTGCDGPTCDLGVWVWLVP